MALNYKISYSYTYDLKGHYANFGPCKNSAIKEAKKLHNSADLNGLFVFSYDEDESKDFSDIVYFDHDGSTTKHLNWVR